jgi:hypothetical protein
MDASTTQVQPGWRFGLHPAATGAVIRSLTRVTLPVGEALRIEMAETPTAESIHVQYYVATESGGWALWISAAPQQLDEADATLPDYASPAETDGPS